MKKVIIYVAIILLIIALIVFTINMYVNYLQKNRLLQTMIIQG